MAEPTALDLEIVTPEKVLLAEPVAEFVGPGWRGQFGVRPGHRSMVIALSPGVVAYTTPGGGTERIAVGGGFAVVEPDHATVLADVAERGDEVDVERARAAAERTKHDLDGMRLDDPEYAERRAAFERAVARLAAAGQSPP